MPTSHSHECSSESSDAAAKAAALAFARHLAASWSARSGSRALGLYAIGSLAHGGFSRRYSDLDLALIMDNVDASAIGQMRLIASSLSSDFAAKLSLFWTDRRFELGRFPPLDRVDYLDHAIALIERERILPARPSLAEIRSYLRGSPFSDWAGFARHFVALNRLEPEDGKRYLRTMLYPARLIFSWATGDVASNDDAVAFLSQRMPGQLDIALIERALACRRSNGDPAQLFDARAGLLQQVEVCEELLASWPLLGEERTTFARREPYGS
jgi:hypothetical protein